jgi:hypothetical protein
MSDRRPTDPDPWSLLTAHGKTLAVIIADPHVPAAEVAVAAGLAHDTVQAIVTDLEQAGYLSRAKPGEPHRHTVHFDKLRDIDGLGGCDLRQVLQALRSAPPSA